MPAVGECLDPATMARQYKRAAYSVAHKMRDRLPPGYDLDDAAHAMLVHLSKPEVAGSYDPQFGVKPLTWVRRVCVQVVRDLARRHRRRVNLLGPTDQDADTLPCPSRDAVRWSDDDWERLLSRISDRHCRRAVELKYRYNHTDQHIAAELGLKVELPKVELPPDPGPNLFSMIDVPDDQPADTPRLNAQAVPKSAEEAVAILVNEACLDLAYHLPRKDQDILLGRHRSELSELERTSSIKSDRPTAGLYDTYTKGD